MAKVKGYDEWASKYKPINNKFLKHKDPLFSDYGQEEDFVEAYDPKHVWTLLEGKSGLEIVKGQQSGVVLGYYITEVPWGDESAFGIATEAIEPYQLPENLEDFDWKTFDFDQWNGVVEALKLRIEELEASLVSEFIREGLSYESIGPYDASELALEVADEIKDPIHKIEFLNEAFWVLDTESSNPDYPYELESLMLKIVDTVEGLKTDAEFVALHKALREWMSFDDMMHMPIAVTSALALIPRTDKVSSEIMDAFLGCWDWDEESSPSLLEDNNWLILDDTLADYAPLTALLCITKGTHQAKVEKLLKLSVESTNTEYSDAFWEYLCGYLADDRESGPFWSPSRLWNDAFFRHLPAPSKLPNVDQKAAYKALEFFWANLAQLETLTNVHGEQIVATHVAALLAAHPLTPKNIRADAQAYVDEHGVDEVVDERPSVLGKLKNLFGKKL